MKVQLNDIRHPDTHGGMEPVNHSPALDYCRKLISEGVDGNQPLKVYRGDALAYTVSSIKWGATKKIREDKYRGPEVVKYKPFVSFK